MTYRPRYVLYDGDDARAAHWALTVGGYDTSRISCYDEEGVEGWQWSGPNNETADELGDWNEPPPIPSFVYNAYIDWLSNFDVIESQG